MPIEIIELNIDGNTKVYEISPNMRLVELLKREAFKGLRQACDGGHCGGCTILMDKKPVLSCLMHCQQTVGKELLTIEGAIHYNPELEMLPKLFKAAGSSQCGFCTCGFVMATAGLYFENRAPTEKEITTALSGNLCRCTGYEKIIDGVWRFFKAINSQSAYTPTRFDFDTVGKRYPKIDGDILTNGKSVYASDMTFPDQLVMRLLPSRETHAKILKIDTSAAESLEGVHLVLTHLNTPETKFTSAAQGYPESSPHDMRLFDKKIRYYGEPVAAVVADNHEIAEKALQRIKVDYEKLPVMLNLEDSYPNPKAQIHEREGVDHIHDHSQNLVSEFRIRQGTVSWDKELIIVENTFETSKQHQVHLEPHTSLAHMDEYERIHIFSSTQVPFDARQKTAKILNVPFNKIRVIKPRIGGGFGGKQEVITEPLVAWATLKTGRPVKLLLNRKEEFLFGRSRHPFSVKLRLGFSTSGRLINMEADIKSDTGAYGGHASTVTELAALRMMSLYKVKNVMITARSIYTNKMPSGAFRGYGVPQAMFPLETLMDEAAGKLNLDPGELRSMNHIKEGDYLPFKDINPAFHPVAERINTCKLEQLISQGKKHLVWDKKSPQTDSDYFYGKGMGISFQGSGIANITRSAATVSLNEDGTLQLLAGAVDVGTGSDTILVQMASQVLSLSPDAIHLITADTATTPYDSGSYASNTTFFSGQAVVDACLKLKRQLLDWVSQKYHIEFEELKLENNHVVSANNKFTLAAIAGAIFSDFTATETVFSATVKKSTAASSFVACFVDLKIKKKTGKVTVDKVVQMVDCGRVINPLLAEGQVEGSVLQAIGYALYENYRHSPNGIPKEKNLLQYKIPTIFEKPEIKVEFIESYEPTGPLGAKGLGEAVFASIPGAINNAICNAIGSHCYRLPITPEMILDLIVRKQTMA